MKAYSKAILAAVVAALGIVLVVACTGGGSSPARPPAGQGGGAFPGLPELNSQQQGLLTYSVPCYVAQGGRNIVAADGCTITVLDGGALDLESGASVTGVITNDLDGAQLILDPGGTTKIQATANWLPKLTLGGTPTAAAFAINDSAGTPVALLRGANGIELLKGPVVFGTSVPVAGVASTAIAPVGVLQPVSMATAGTVPITIPPAGQFVCIWNTGTETVTIADTGNQVMNGSIALGQYDVVCGLSDGTRFIQAVPVSNN